MVGWLQNYVSGKQNVPELNINEFNCTQCKFHRRFTFLYDIVIFVSYAALPDLAELYKSFQQIRIDKFLYKIKFIQLGG